MDSVRFNVFSSSFLAFFLATEFNYSMSNYTTSPSDSTYRHPILFSFLAKDDKRCNYSSDLQTDDPVPDKADDVDSEDVTRPKSIYPKKGGIVGTGRRSTVSNAFFHRTNVIYTKSSSSLSRWLLQKQTRLHDSLLVRSISNHFESLTVSQNHKDHSKTEEMSGKSSSTPSRDKIRIEVNSASDKSEQILNSSEETEYGDDTPTSSNKLQLPFFVVRSISYDAALTEAPTVLMQFKVL